MGNSVASRGMCPLLVLFDWLIYFGKSENTEIQKLVGEEVYTNQNEFEEKKLKL